MALPKLVSAGVCAAILGAQLWVSVPVSKELRSWYWPFLPYPMYAVAHKRDDQFVVSQLRVNECGKQGFATTLAAEDLGLAWDQLSQALVYAARGSHDARGDRERAMISLAIEAQHPGCYCSASVWVRAVSVGDTSTHHIDAARRMAAEWPVDAGRAK